jgi:spermidine/putrescine transport system permease protein
MGVAMSPAKILRWVVIGCILTFLFAPVIVVVLFSFNSVASTALPFKGFSLRWYDQVIGDEEFRSAAKNSLIVAGATVVFVVTVGTAAAFGLSRKGSQRLTSAVNLLVVTPLILPGLFLGVSLLLFAGEIGLQPSLPLVFIGHSVITVPFVVLVVSARLQHFDYSIVEAARDLGAGSVRAFLKIVLPLVAPAIVGAALLTVAWSFDEFIVTLFTNGGNATLPVLIFSRARLGLDPGINVIATFVLTITVASALVASRFLSPSEVAQ